MLFNARTLKVITIILTIFAISGSLTVCSNSIPNIKTNENYDTLSEKNSDYDLLIITPMRYTVILRILAQHKEKHDIKTKIVNLEKIYQNDEINGRDNQEKIKYYIKNQLDNHNITYVLLVGDFKCMPIRYIHNVDLNVSRTELKYISDLYYADIYDKNGSFSSWDTNGNGIYGEWNGSTAQDKNIDLKPDICLGRLPCSNIFEVMIMVKKIINYEKNTNEQPWFKRIIGVGGDSYPKHEGYEGEINTQNAMNNMQGFVQVKLWTSNGKLNNEQSVIKEMNKGCGFIYFDGHGTPYAWGTHPPNDGKTFVFGLKNSNMFFLHNRNKLPICVVSACHNCQFDVHPARIFTDPYYSYTWVKECWGWHLTSKYNGGAIATIGNTATGYSKEDKQSQKGADSYLDPKFFWEYGINGTDILGKAWANAINDYLDEFPIDWDSPSGSDYSIDAKTVQQWVLIGDPSLKIGGYQI